MPLAGAKRPAADELAREGGGGAEAGGGGGGADAPAVPAAPFADVQPSIKAADVHVLLADDEKISRLVTAKLLRSCGYQVTAVDSGRAALLALGEAPAAYSLILTDVAMPDVNGLEVLRYVRSQPALHALPVVMMSAHENAGTVFECIQRGAEDYLLKPVTAKEAKQLWQHVWRRRYSWRRVPGPSRGTGADEVLRAAPAPEASAEVTGAEAAGEEEGSEMYTAAEMRDHCMRQIARYTRVIQIIDSHPHLFPGAAAGAAAAAAGGATDGQAA